MNEFLVFLGVLAGAISIVGFIVNRAFDDELDEYRDDDPSLAAIHGEELHEALSDEEATDLMWKDWEEARNLNG